MYFSFYDVQIDVLLAICVHYILIKPRFYEWLYSLPALKRKCIFELLTHNFFRDGLRLVTHDANLVIF